MVKKSIALTVTVALFSAAEFLIFHSVSTYPAAAFQTKRSSGTGLFDLSSSTVRAELAAQGLNLSTAATPPALREALVQYDFQAGNGFNLNSNRDDLVKAIKDLNVGLSQTSLQAHITVRTKKPGARIWYRLIGREDSRQINQLTNRAEDDISIGLYFLWAERNGNATSSKTQPFRILRAREPMDLEEIIR